MTTMSSSGSVKQIYLLAPRTGKIPYAINVVVATIWGSSSQLSDLVFLPFSTKGGAQARAVLAMIYLLENSDFNREDRMVWKIKVFV